METTRKLSEIDPKDLPVLERVFGRPIEPNAGSTIVLRTVNAP